MSNSVERVFSHIPQGSDELDERCPQSSESLDVAQGTVRERFLPSLGAYALSHVEESVLFLRCLRGEHRLGKGLKGNNSSREGT